MEKTKEIILDYPITMQGKEYTQINLREPIVNEMILSAKILGNKKNVSAAYDYQIDLIARVSGLPTNVVEMLPSSILDQSVSYLTYFQEIESDHDEETITIDPPMTLVNGDQVTELTLHEPTVGQRKKALKLLDHYGETMAGALEFQVSLVTQVTEEKMATILKLPISTFNLATQYLMRFFPNGQQTGANLDAN